MPRRARRRRARQCGSYVAHTHSSHGACVRKGTWVCQVRSHLAVPYLLWHNHASLPRTFDSQPSHSNGKAIVSLLPPLPGSAPPRPSRKCILRRRARASAVVRRTRYRRAPLRVGHALERPLGDAQPRQQLHVRAPLGVDIGWLVKEALRAAAWSNELV